MSLATLRVPNTRSPSFRRLRLTHGWRFYFGFFFILAVDIGKLAGYIKIAKQWVVFLLWMLILLPLQGVAMGWFDKFAPK